MQRKLVSIAQMALFLATMLLTCVDQPTYGQGSERGLGLILRDADNEIIVHSVRPGSPADMTELIAPGAKITAIRIGSQTIALKGKTSRDVAQLVRSARFDERTIMLSIVPPDEETVIDVAIERSDADVDADHRLYRIRIEKPTPLHQAVRDFNARAAHHSIGRSQPPLTVAEVIAAIRRDRRKKQPQKRTFAKIVETETLQSGDELSFTPGLVSDGYRFTVWWIDLKVENGGLRIRDRTLSSRELTDNEKAAQIRFEADLMDALQRADSSK